MFKLECYRTNTGGNNNTVVTNNFGDRTYQTYYKYIDLANVSVVTYNPWPDPFGVGTAHLIIELYHGENFDIEIDDDDGVWSSTSPYEFLKNWEEFLEAIAKEIK